MLTLKVAQWRFATQACLLWYRLVSYLSHNVHAHILQASIGISICNLRSESEGLQRTTSRFAKILMSQLQSCYKICMVFTGHTHDVLSKYMANAGNAGTGGQGLRRAAVIE
eukprot:3366823-Amphidinium_carterae.1